MNIQLKRKANSHRFSFAKTVSLFTLLFGMLFSYNALAQPANDLCAGAIELFGDTVLNATTVGGTQSDEPADCNTIPNNNLSFTYTNNPGVWYYYTATADATLFYSVCSPLFTTFAMYSGSCGAFTCEAGSSYDCSDTLLVNLPITNGVTYYFYIAPDDDNFTTGGFPFELILRGLSSAPINDTCSGAIPITCGQTISGTTIDATVDTALGFCGTDNSTSPGVWYLFEGTGTAIEFSTCNQATYDTKIGVFSGTCGALVCEDGNDDGLGCAGLTSNVTINTIIGTDYYVYVSGFGGQSGDFDLTATRVSPIIAPTAVDTSICINEAVDLRATGSGIGEIVWYDDTYSEIERDAMPPNTATLTVGPFLVPGTYVYYATEADCGLESDSTVIRVEVRDIAPAPTVTGDTEVCEGESVVLTAPGTGGQITWYADAGLNTVVSIGSQYITDHLTSDTTFYVAENCGNTFTTVSITVNPMPAAPTPVEDTVYTTVGQSVELSATSSVVDGIFSWYDGDPNLGGALIGTGNPFNTPIIYNLETHFYVTVSDPNFDCGNNLRAPQMGAASLIVVLAALPPDAVIAEGDTICEGDVATLTATPQGAGVTVWFSDGAGADSIATGNTFTTPILTQTTTYYAAELDSTGYGTIIGVQAVVNPKPTPPNAPTQVTECTFQPVLVTFLDEQIGDFLHFIAIDSLGDTVANFIDPIFDLSQDIVGFFINAEEQTIVLSVIDATTGCESDVSILNVTTIDPPAAPTVTGDSTTCPGGSTILTAAGSGGLITWYSDAGLTNVISTGSQFNTGTIIMDTTFYVTETNVDVTTCESEATVVNVTTNDIPLPPTVLDTVRICQGETAVLFAYGQVANPNSIITWFDNPNFDPLALGWQYETQPLDSSKVFYATVTNEEGCQSEKSQVVVIVNTKPNNPIVTNDTVCRWSPATLTAAGGGQYTWYSDGAGANIVATGATYTTPDLAQTTTFYVKITSPRNGCSSDIVGVTAVVLPGPDAPQAGNITLCVNETGELTATGSGTGSLIWYDANQVQIEVDAMPPANGSLAVGPFATAGTYFFYVSENDGSCESQLEEIEVVVGDVSVAPTAQGDTICAGETATLTAIGTGGVINWYADGALTIPLSSGSQYTTDELLVTTSFWVAESFGSCESTPVEVEVVVNPLPATPTAGSNAPICEGATLMLTASNAFGATYQWNGPNGFTSTLQNPTIDNVTEANNQGVYTVTVTNNTTGCTSGTASVTVDILPTPDAPSISSNSPLCEGEDLILTASNVVGATYTWYDGSDNIITTTAVNTLTIPTVTLADAGTYGVSVNVSGCESPTNTTVVVVKSRPDAPAVSNNSPICEFETLILSAQVISGATYTWTGPSGSIAQNGPIVTIPNATVANAGTYGVFITVNGCSSDTVTTEVVITPAPVLPQNPTTNSPVCEHDMLILEAPYDANLTYNWTGPNGYVADTTYIDTVNNFYVEAIFDANENDHQGFYTLVVTDNTTGCDSKPYPVLVIVNKFPDNVIADNNGPACEGDDVQLTVTSIVNATYTWTGPLNYVSFEQNPILENVTPDMSGTYEVTIMLGGCTSMTVSTDVLIRANPIADAGEDLFIEEGTVFQLDGNGSTGAIDFAWLGEDQSYFDNPTSPNPFIGLNGPLPARDEPYIFVLTVYNQFGCTDMDTVLVYVYATTDLVIPNIITPNGDGVNDSWVVQYLENLDNYVLSIYARGGTLVLKTSTYNNDWYGTNVDGDDLPEGTYWYTIRSDDELVFKGYIEILR